MAENLPLRHAQHLAGLLLAEGHALNAAAVYLGEIAGVVYDEHHRRRGEAALGKAPGVVVHNHAGHVEDYVQLQHERRAADNPDDEAAEKRERPEAREDLRPEAQALRQPAGLGLAERAGRVSLADGDAPSVLEQVQQGLLPGVPPAAERAERRPAVHGAEADYEAQGNGADKRHHKELQRRDKALVQGEKYGLEFRHRGASLLSAPKAENARAFSASADFLGYACAPGRGVLTPAG